MEVTETNILHALHDLGRSHQKVAKKLRSLGIRGRRRGLGTCPVAMYLRQVFVIDVTKFAVGLNALYIGDVESTLPRATQSFIANFDDGAYPDLEEAS